MPSCKSDKRKILCKCPQCGKNHIRYMWWTGKEAPYKPRIVCVKCTKAKYVILNEDQSEAVLLLMDVFDV